MEESRHTVEPVTRLALLRRGSQFLVGGPRGECRGFPPYPRRRRAAGPCAALTTARINVIPGPATIC
jgi:hypothetical protein